MELEETEIKVPWGYIAAKIWGNQQDPMVLVFHGIMDNAGSFDRLIPFLPKSFCYICTDLPGHGKSSHFPTFFPIYTTNIVIGYKLIVQHFKRQKYIIMGHSYGGQIGFLFTQLYPEYVEKLIMLDTIHLYPTSARHFKHILRDSLDFCIALEEKVKTRNKPTYTYTEALRKLQDQRFESVITPEAAEALLQRGITLTENGKYKFTMDYRIKHAINPLHDFDYVIGTIKKAPVKCPVLIILGQESRIQQIYMRPLIDLLKEYTNVTIKVVEGHHDVHNNTPDIVAPLIAEFMLVQKAKL